MIIVYAIINMDIGLDGQLGWKDLCNHVSDIQS